MGPTGLRLSTTKLAGARHLAAILPVLVGLSVLLAPMALPPASATGDASSMVTRPVAQIGPASSCLSATVISPSSLPFTDESTTTGAGNDVDPGVSGCALGLGADVVYSFTPSQTDIYTAGATPTGAGFDISLYIITDCDNPAASCVVGANRNGFALGETVSATLTAGTRYFIVVDSPIQTDSGSFHFALRRGTPENNTCATPFVIDTSFLPFSLPGTTFGATNDLNPGQPCLRVNRSGRGADVVYQFTPLSTQVYIVTATPVGLYDIAIYVVTNCNTLASCQGGDLGGAGAPENVRRNLVAGTTYFIVVDGSVGEAGDFVLSIEPTIPIAPAAPSDLVATVISANEVELNWRDNSDNENGFRIQRSLNGVDFDLIATVGSNVSTFRDTTVFPSTTFFYRVIAFNQFGSSPPSNIADATTPAPPPPPTPLIEVSPTSLEFGSVRATTSAELSITIASRGGANLIISAITEPVGPFTIVNRPALPLTLGLDESISLTVRFTPPSAGSFASFFNILSNDATSPSISINLTGIGTGQPVPNIQLNTSFLDFAGGESTGVIEVRNTGDADLLVSSIIRPSAPFSVITGSLLSITLEPEESMTVIVAFSPAFPGVFTSDLTFVSNDPDQSLNVVRLRGVSTPTNEVLRLRGPTQVTIAAGESAVLNMLAANGVNTDIQLSGSSTIGGTFVDRGSGRGDLTINPDSEELRNIIVSFSARDSAGRTKSMQGVVSVLAPEGTNRIQVLWTAPNNAPDPPTSVFANDLSITPFASLTFEGVSDIGPANAPGLIGYVVYRGSSAGVLRSLSNIVAVIPVTQTSVTDRIPAPPGDPGFFFYRVSSLYVSGTESSLSNESFSGPRMPGVRWKNKAIQFQAANSNVGAGAVLIFNGNQTFTLERSGNLIIANKDARSTPGNLRVRDIFKKGTTHTLQVRNPGGALSPPQTVTR